MLLLALDSSDAVAVAVVEDGRLLAASTQDDPRRHTELLAPAVRDVLAAAGVDRRDLDAVAVGVGPAPFTGLRVGVVTALTLGEALGVPVHGLCSLDALAATALAGAPVALAGGFVVATDARRREVHWARYAVADAADPVRGWERVEGPGVGAPTSVPRAGLPCVGRGARLHPDALPGPPPSGDAACSGGTAVRRAALTPALDAALTPAPLAAVDPAPLAAVDPALLAAVVVDRLARGGAGLLPPEPLYLRRPDATEPGARKRVTP